MTRKSQLSLQAISCGRSHVGKVRQLNEDCFAIQEDLQVYVVADGMGGHKGGIVASHLAVETIGQVAKEALKGKTSQAKTGELLPEIIVQAMAQACEVVQRRSLEDLALDSMGTTAVMLAIAGKTAALGHIGDSRAYFIRDGKIRQLTQDHSLVNEQIWVGMMTPQDAEQAAYRNVISRSVGFEAQVQVDVISLTVQKGDRFLLCSDGLTNKISDIDLLKIAEVGKLETAADKLVDIANDRGGEDNITLVLVELVQRTKKREKPDK